MSRYFGPSRREYNIITGMAAYRKTFQKDFIDFFGYAKKDIVIVINDDKFYFYEDLNERYKAAKNLIKKKINENEIDFETTIEYINKKVDEFYRFIKTSRKNYSLATYKKLIGLYHDIMPLYFASIDTINFEELVDRVLRVKFRKWATTIRLRSEAVYKDGEMKFVPAYLSWFSQKYCHNIDINLLKYIQHSEMIGFIDRNSELPGATELEKRKKFLVLIQKPPDKEEIFFGKQASEELSKRGIDFFEDQKHLNVDELRGVTAFGGRAIGKAKIVLSTRHMDKVETGDILVSQMTIPDYLPIMKKAAAIITDEGGLLCHAAIVARELKKPCIIATKVATKAICDGDTIEVDADIGVARIKR